MPLIQGSTTCPLCPGQLSEPAQDLGNSYDLRCGNCGDYRLTPSADAVLAGPAYNAAGMRPRMAHSLRRMPRPVIVDSELLLRLSEAPALPSALQRIDNLVVHLGELAPGQSIFIGPGALRAVVGAEDSEAVAWVVSESVDLGLVRVLSRTLDGSFHGVSLTARGWSRYAELSRSAVNSNRAFMAMKFNDLDLNKVYREHMKPAVLQTGFVLAAANDDHQAAGSIDDRMRVEIRVSRFVVCDLSHASMGAYWEAGFAEGVGRPVIYTCRRDVLEDKTHEDHPHFDTAHQLIIPWDVGNLDEFRQKLKNAIRATLSSDPMIRMVD